ncbi:MAG: hypothetical protein RLZZ127_2194 [Planctomycetota bacterium]|jgi:regulator of replication initiation timing
MESPDAQLRRTLVEALSRVGELADHAAGLAGELLDDRSGTVVRGPDEDAALTRSVLDRLAGIARTARADHEALRAEIQQRDAEVHRLRLESHALQRQLEHAESAAEESAADAAAEVRSLVSEILSLAGGLDHAAVRTLRDLALSEGMDAAALAAAAEPAVAALVADRDAAIQNATTSVGTFRRKAEHLDGDLAQAKAALAAMAQERDRLAAALERSRRDTDDALREAEAKATTEALRATELSRQLAELKASLGGSERRSTPNTAAIEALLAEERAARHRERQELTALLQTARAAVARAKAQMQAAGSK